MKAIRDESFQICSPVLEMSTALSAKWDLMLEAALHRARTWLDLFSRRSGIFFAKFILKISLPPPPVLYLNETFQPSPEEQLFQWLKGKWVKLQRTINRWATSHSTQSPVPNAHHIPLEHHRKAVEWDFIWNIKNCWKKLN